MNCISQMISRSVFIIFIGLCIVNANDSVRKKMKINLADVNYAPQFKTDSLAYCKGKAIFVSSIESLDEEDYGSDDGRVKYNVDDLEDYFENWVKAAFEHAGLLMQEPPSYWQRAFSPTINVSVNQAQSSAPKGMFDFRINIPKYSENSAEMIIEGYIEGRIVLKETVRVTFPSPSLNADKAALIANASSNLDILAMKVLSNEKFKEALENTNQ